MELYHLRSLNDPLTKVVKDDPVRPHIPLEQRINDAAEILILKAGEEILAATCLQWLSGIPKDEQDLVDMGKDKHTAVFYTIWSYKPGAGATLLKQAAEWILSEVKDVKNIVTLSPQTVDFRLKMTSLLDCSIQLLNVKLWHLLTTPIYSLTPQPRKLFPLIRFRTSFPRHQALPAGFLTANAMQHNFTKPLNRTKAVPVLIQCFSRCVVA